MFLIHICISDYFQRVVRTLLSTVWLVQARLFFFYSWLVFLTFRESDFSLRKCMKIPPKSFVTRFNDFGRVSFNGKFYQSLLILQAFIFMSRKHSIRFEFIFYSILFLFIAYFANIYFYKTLPSWIFHLENQNYFLWFLQFRFEFRMSSGPTKDEILDVLPKELTDNVVTQKDREKYSHILRKFFMPVSSFV